MLISKTIENIHIMWLTRFQGLLKKQKIAIQYASIFQINRPKKKYNIFDENSAFAK